VKSNRTADRLARALLVAMFAAAAWTWPSAPVNVPIHWNFAGQINGYGSKFSGLLLVPIIALASYSLIGLTAVMRPEKFDGPARAALSWFRLMSVLVMAGVYGVIVADARGADANMNQVIFPLLALMLVAIANLILQLNRVKKGNTTPPCGGVIE